MYKQGDKAFIKNTWKTKFNQGANLGPYTIIAVRNNGTVRTRKGRVMEICIIQNLTPYKE